MATHDKEITAQCDIFSIGSILYRLLFGEPLPKIYTEMIAHQKLHERSPDANVYKVPDFMEGRILSNEMCKILVCMLHQNPKYRTFDLETVKNQLLSLRVNIFDTPVLMRRVLKHPDLPGESLDEISHDDLIDFRAKPLSKFSLKYLAKFICQFNLHSISINGAAMPLRSIMSNQLVELNLRDCGLYSEDLFILAQVMKFNSSLTSINLSKNLLGYTYVEEKKVLDMKMKHQNRL